MASTARATYAPRRSSRGSSPCGFSSAAELADIALCDKVRDACFEGASTATQMAAEDRKRGVADLPLHADLSVTFACVMLPLEEPRHVEERCVDRLGHRGEWDNTTRW